MIHYHQRSIPLLLLILCLLSILSTLSFNPTIRKSYFGIKPNSTFSYEFPQTSNGTYALYIDNSGSSPISRYILFNLTAVDAYIVLEKTASACQVASPIFQHIHYHVQTNNLVYFCAANSSLLFIDQASQTVSTSISLNLNQTYPTAKLSSDGMNIIILAMNNLFTENPQSSLLININMQSKQVVSQLLFNQCLSAGESVVAYTPGNKTNYIATHLWQNNSLLTTIYNITIVGNTYEIKPVFGLASSNKTVTKLFAIGDYVIVNIDSTLYFLDSQGAMYQRTNIRTKELTPGIFHPAVVRSTDGYNLHLQNSTLQVTQYTINNSNITSQRYGTQQDMLIAHANQTSNDLMFTADMEGMSFDIIDLKIQRYLRTIPADYIDLMLTDWTWVAVQNVPKTNTTFNDFDLITNYAVQWTSVASTKYYYNKDQHIITWLSAPEGSSCQLTHLDLVSTRVWTTLNFNSADICSSYVSYSRMADKKNPEVVIPLNQSYLIVSLTCGQIIFNASSPTHDTDSIAVNFDDVSLYYYTTNQVLKNINASLYIFSSQTKNFQLNSTKFLNLKPVEKNGLFTLNENYTLALSDVSITLINKLDSQWSNLYANNFNLATSFEDNSGALFVFLSYFNADAQSPQGSSPVIYGNDGKVVAIPARRNTTVSGQATGPKTFALYDRIYSSVGVVRHFDADPRNNSKTVISL